MNEYSKPQQTLGTTPTLAVLISCFNRKATTLACLRTLAAAVQGKFSYTVFLVDDGSTDGTGDAVKELFPDTVILQGSGNLFWNGGMRFAWQSASKGNFDFYLWLNDDVSLRAGSLARLLDCYQEAAKRYTPKTIVVGRTIDPQTGKTSYGGYARRSAVSKLSFRHLNDGEIECDTMNGNCVLFPKSAVAEVGVNAEQYRHWAGDVDYGLRAKRAGYTILQLPEPVAELGRNDAYAAKVSRLTPKNYKFILFHPKGIPMQEWAHFCRSHGGFTWPINFLLRYLRILRWS